MMKNRRMFQFAFAGLLMALILQAVGYRLDQVAPHIRLENQALYNWLTLLFSPVALFLRLGTPGGPIVAGWGSFFAVLSSNVLLYATFCGACQVLFKRMQQKLAHEDALRLIADRSKIAGTLAGSELKHGRV